MPSRARTHTLPNGQLSIYCWCQNTIVFVDPKVVQAGRTASCGARHCHEPDQAA